MTKLSLIGGLVLGLAAVLLNCGSEDNGSQFSDAGTEDTGVVQEPPLFGRDGAVKPCVGLECQQVACDGGGTTTLAGTVYDPAGKVPLYNALVYVPNGPLAPITTGASCDRCGTVSGTPLVTALTGPDGQFKLENVPVGANIPLVVQIGKWRRQTVIPVVEACVSQSVVEGSVRLPRNRQEGDLPQMALASGNADPFECLLTKMGIDPTEFTSDAGSGRVHYYRENGVDTNPSAPAASTLYGNLGKMRAYDVIFLPCEGSEHNRPDATDQNLVDYTSLGGRLFTTHYGYSWLHQGVTPFPGTGQWQPEQAPVSNATPLTSIINQSFPKGKAFAEWLVNVKASTTPGELELLESRHDLNAANDPPSTTWMTTSEFPPPNTAATLHITFNTPVGQPADMQCGRVVFSDFHVSASAKTSSPTFPASCKTGDLSAQEKALEFMVFDLSSCIQNDKEVPSPPLVVK